MKSIRTVAVALSLGVLALAACAPASSGSSGPNTSGQPTKPTIRIGSTNFSEQQIVAELYAQSLESVGYRIERRLNLGSREVVAPAIESNQIDMYPEYLATYITFITKDPTKASTDSAATAKNLQDALKAKRLSVLDFAPAIDTNGFVVTKATAQRLGLTKVSDLARQNGQLVLGGPAECPDRPFCLKGLEGTYALKFKEFKPLDAGGPLTVAALEGNQVDVAVLFTTDAIIDAKGFVLLQDDKRLQLADNIAPVVRDELLEKVQPDFKTTINAVSAKLTTEEMTALNRQVNVDKKDPKDVASAWLKAKGLVK